MFHRFRGLFRIGLTLILVTIAAVLLWVFTPMISGFPIVVRFGPTAPSAQRSDCREFADVLLVYNRSIFPAPMRDWWVTDEYGRYQFPDRWLAPGEEIRVWSTSGQDDATNIYTGRQSPVWETSNFGYHVTYFEHSQELFKTTNCDPVW